MIIVLQGGHHSISSIKPLSQPIGTNIILTFMIVIEIKNGSETSLP